VATLQKRATIDREGKKERKKEMEEKDKERKQMERTWYAN